MAPRKGEKTVTWTQAEKDQVVSLRDNNNLDWESIAARLGTGRHAESCKRAYYYIKNPASKPSYRAQDTGTRGRRPARSTQIARRAKKTETRRAAQRSKPTQEKDRNGWTLHEDEIMQELIEHDACVQDFTTTTFCYRSEADVRENLNQLIAGLENDEDEDEADDDGDIKVDDDPDAAQTVRLAESHSTMVTCQLPEYVEDGMPSIFVSRILPAYSATKGFEEDFYRPVLSANGQGGVEGCFNLHEEPSHDQNIGYLPEDLAPEHGLQFINTHYGYPDPFYMDEGPPYDPVDPFGAPAPYPVYPIAGAHHSTKRKRVLDPEPLDVNSTAQQFVPLPVLHTDDLLPTKRQKIVELGQAMLQQVHDHIQLMWNHAGDKPQNVELDFEAMTQQWHRRASAMESYTARPSLSDEELHKLMDPRIPRS